MPPHLPQKQQHGGHKAYGTVGQHPEQMGPDIAVAAAEHRPLHLHRVDKGQGVGNGLERAAHQVQIEPDSGEPGGEIGQQGAADAAHLFIGKYTAKEKPQGDEEDLRRDKQQHGPEHIYCQLQSQTGRRQVAQYTLGRRDGQHGQHIAQNVVRGAQGRGVKPLQQGRGAVFGDQGGGKQGHKGQTEHGKPRSQHFQREKTDGDIGLYGAEQKQQHQRKAQAEAQVQRVAEDLLRRAQRIREHTHHHSASFTSFTKASSKRAAPARSLISAGVPTAIKRPFFIMPVRSERDSASSM